MKKDKKKSKWQAKREKEASKNSQFDPKIMKRDIEATEEELSGKNLPFKSEK
jgi:hypothetical protein